MTFMISTEGFQLDDSLRERAQLLSEKFHEKLSCEDRLRMNMHRTDKRHVEANVHIHTMGRDFVGHGRSNDAIRALNDAMEHVTRQALSARKKMIDGNHRAPSASEFVRS
jgi:ribosome-associated translation inhibitor RaiA